MVAIWISFRVLCVIGNFCWRKQAESTWLFLLCLCKMQITILSTLNLVTMYHFRGPLDACCEYPVGKSLFSLTLIRGFPIVSDFIFIRALLELHEIFSVNFACAWISCIREMFSFYVFFMITWYLKSLWYTKLWWFVYFIASRTFTPSSVLQLKGLVKQIQTC